jgi:hypothetical protein
MQAKELQRGLGHLAKILVVLCCSKAEQPKVKRPYVRGISSARIKPSKKLGTGDRKLERLQEEGGADGKGR